MAEAVYVHDGNETRFVAAAALASGEILQDDDGSAIVVAGLKGFALGEQAAAYRKGVFDVASATGTTFSKGDPVYWDASAGLAVTSPGAVDDVYLGTADKAKASGPLVVRVRLNEGFAGAGSSGQRGTWVTRAVVLDHADAAEHEVVAAAENPLGLLVLSFHGVVTEAPAGSSEDQLILDLQDEDDAVLSQITTTNTTPDAAGDVVIGTRTLGAGATGDVASVIPAGKSAHVQVTQATAGMPAGAVRVSVLVAPLL